MLSKNTKALVDEQLNNNLPEFTSGDTIKVNVKIKEGEKYRIQAFEGVVIKTQGSGISFSVCVRKNSSGIFVERTFPVHSPIIDSIEVIKRGRVRRARIYYIRKLSGKAARIKEVVHSKSKDINAKKAVKAAPKKPASTK
ncbi:50S ribosomal protein L19 [Spiroplasma gladiatoris]